MSGRIILDGSFISAKAEPGDFDLLFVYDEASQEVLDEDETARLWVEYAYLKEVGYGDVLAFRESLARQYPQLFPLNGFDRDKTSQRPKGVVEVNL